MKVKIELESNFETIKTIVSDMYANIEAKGIDGETLKFAIEFNAETQPPIEEEDEEDPRAVYRVKFEDGEEKHFTPTNILSLRKSDPFKIKSIVFLPENRDVTASILGLVASHREPIIKFNAKDKL